MAHMLRKLWLLVWKNFILQIRRPIGTAVELILPVAFLALLILARISIKNKEVCMSNFQPFNLKVGTPRVLQNFNFKSNLYPKYLAYYQSADGVTDIMQRAANGLGLNATNTTELNVPFKSLEDMTNYVTERPELYLGAIVFRNIENGKPLPKVIMYDVRLHHKTATYYDSPRESWMTKTVYPLFRQPGPRKNNIYKNLFITIQYHVDSSIIKHYTNNDSLNAPMIIQQFPYPDYREDTFIAVVQSLMPIIFVIAYVYTAVMIVKELVAEKQFRLKESMKMMGLANWMHWTAWFIKCFLFFLVIIILQTILLKAGKVFEFSEGSVIFVFLLLYVVSCISMLFFLSTIFSNAVRGMLFTAVIWFGSWAPYASISNPEKYEGLTSGQKFAICLLPNSCLGIAVQIISRRESLQTGMKWSAVNKNPSVDDTFSLGNCFGAFIFDVLLYMLLTWYIENVFPGQFGIPKPPWFFLTPSYWCRTKDRMKGGSVRDMQKNKNTGSNFEEEPEGVEVGISINELRKVYKGATGKKVALESLSLNIYKGQITALLGHNGAGKTTTMSILTGLFPPTAGGAYINGHSILNGMDQIRESLGLCPQHNVLFDRLTVKEHLEFFTALKGINKKVAASEIKQMIIDIQLTDKENSPSSTLSGGMKRKLNCAIALIGGSQTVFLDEPTSGMDPYARRATWDLLQKYRENKTIVLTTHFMDEADYLGDRIAIMADGELRCCGSSLFLKKRYGVGYHMTIVKGPEFKENQTQSLIAKAIPSSKIVGNIGAEMSYVLEEQSTKYFKGLFEELEDKKNEYGISTFGVSVTTLEEVFLKVGEGETLTGVEDINDTCEESETIHKIDRMESKLQRKELLAGSSLFFSQFTAMFVKRFLNSKRQKVAIVTQVILPTLLVLFGFLLAMSVDSTANDGPRKFTLAMLKSKEEIIESFFADFRPNHSSILDISAGYYSSVETNMMDITSKALEIKNQNENNNVNVLFSDKKVSGIIDDSFGICCKYKFLVLNQQCIDKLKSKQNLTNTCGTSPKDFGYSNCIDCATKDGTCGKENIRSISDTKLIDQTYFEEYVLEDSSSQDDKTYFNKKVAGFMVAGDGESTVWYSSQSWHGLPSAFTAGSNILMKYYVNKTSGIITRNFPLPRNAAEKSSAATSNSSSATLVNFLSMAAAFIAASFVTFLVVEKSSKAKHIQFVSGVSSWCYWLATFCWDMINFMVPAIIIIILFAIFNLDDYNGELGYVFLVLILFGISILPFVYLTSFLFTSSLIAYSVIALLLMVFSLAMVIAVLILKIVEEEKIAETLHYIFLLFPTYAFPQAISDIATNHNRKVGCANTRQICELKGVKYHDNALNLKTPGIGTHCLFMFLECILYFLLTILIEERFFISACFGGGEGKHPSIRQGEDEDVQEERKKIQQLNQNDISESPVIVRDLTKVYRTTGMMAVDHLCFGVSKKECFGLLGVNGAGKTTTFGMLTGELGITDGTAFLNGYNIQTNLKEVQQTIGYCPQFDALIGKMTGREMLRMFARLRGIPSQMLEDVVTAAVDQLNLGKWADKMCGDYSGGNKRKLSTALALVGDPPVVFLDEPTSGMDPASRRFLWNTLSGVLNSGRSIVLTSHSMEECEALCTKLVIMVNGQLKCIGSIQHLKSRFGRGYTLVMKIGANSEPSEEQKVIENDGKYRTIYDDDMSEKDSSEVIESTQVRITNPSFIKEQGKVSLNVPRTGLVPSSSMENIAQNMTRVKEFVQSTFKDSYLIEERNGFLQYQIMSPDLRWSQIFGALEAHTKQLGVVDYSVSQTSLEQVFINFAKNQLSEDRVFKKTCCSCTCF